MTPPSAGEPSPFRPDAVPPGTNLLVAGPAMTGKRDLVFDLLGESADRTGIVVTTKRSAARVQADFPATTGEGEWDLRVIDCVSQQRAVGGTRDTDTVRYVTSAGDLTGVGIGVSGHLQEFHHDPDVEDARVGLHSLSTMLMYADIRRVYQFVHVVAGRIAHADYVGVFTLDTPSRDTEPFHRLSGLFDGLVEVREGEAGPELRVRGIDAGPRSWTPV